MELEKKFKLFDEIFSNEEASNILNALFNYKIDYHNQEYFSNIFALVKTFPIQNSELRKLLKQKTPLK